MRRSIELGVDLAERILAVALGIPFLLAFYRALPTQPLVVLIAAMETVSVILLLTRRFGQTSINPYAIVIAALGSALPLLVRPEQGAGLPEVIVAPIMFAGFSLALLAKLYLNRSFGLIAANRGVKVKGPYRFVRHPMYLGYIIAQAGFLLANLTAWNAAFYFCAWGIQILRIREEEKLLDADPSYAAFRERVRSRLIPAIY